MFSCHFLPAFGFTMTGFMFIMLVLINVCDCTWILLSLILKQPRYCNYWSEASGFTCSKMFIEQRQKQTGNGQQAKTGISEAEQRRKQYQAGVEVTGTGSEFQGRAVQGQTQRWQEE